MKVYHSRRGSITVEASIVLPVFICAALTLAFLIKLVYVHEVMQHAISRTADEMAAYSYVYLISGMRETDSIVNDGLSERGQRAQGHVNTITDAFDSLKEFPEDISGRISRGENPFPEDENGEDSNPGSDEPVSLEEIKDKIKAAGDSVEEAVTDPVEELKSVGSLIALGGYNDLKTELFKPLIKLHMKKHLRIPQQQDQNKRLLGLNVVDGFEGLDLSETRLFANDRDIDIIVRYRVRTGLPLNILPDVCFIQRATARAWLDGNAGNGSITKENDIWKLPPLERGRKIQDMKGRNLPFNFPVIARFESGKATMIKSLDLREATYRKTNNLRAKLMSYIDELFEFKGGRLKDVSITEGEIISRHLLLVVPEGTITPGIQEVFDECIEEARSKGIEFSIETL